MSEWIKQSGETALQNVHVKTGRGEGWISVEDRLPEIDQYVLWFYQDYTMSVWEIDKDMEFGYLPKEDPNAAIWPTHWMPLPEPPQNS